MKMPTRIYERLTPNERFLAFIEAAARRDGEELDRLNATCPMKNYSIEDPAYFIPKTNAIVLTLATHLEAARHAELATLSMALLVLSRGTHEDMVIDSLGNFVRRYRAHMEGYEKFCSAIGVSADSLRQAFGCAAGPMTEMVLQVAKDHVDTAAEPEEVEAVTTRLLSAWRAPGML